MYAGAAISAVAGLTVVALIPAVKADLRTADPALTAAQDRNVNVLLTLAIVLGLAGAVIWLWMARANGKGRHWARIVSTVLFGLATLELIRARPHYGGGSASRTSSSADWFRAIVRCVLPREPLAWSR